jgi:hypothetical protein
MFNERTSKMSKKISFMCGMAVLVALFTVVGGFAQTSPCPPYPYNDYSVGTGATTLKTAVASNYYCPAIDMVNNFVSYYGAANITVTVHHDSTGALETQIINDPGHDIYDYLFAADSIASSFLTAIGKTPANTFRYANGVPSLFGYKAGGITTVGALITGLGAADNYTVEESGSDLTALNYTVNSTAEDVAVAATPAAPYGTAAAAIFSRFATLPSTTTPYPNISLTYDAVGTAGIPSGVVSKAQICANIAAGAVAHVDFTGYTLEQRAIQLTSTGASLTTWLTSQMAGGSASTWNAFLVAHCYSTIP